MENAQSVVTWRPSPGGEGGFFLGICRWMGRMFTTRLSRMEFHSHHSCGRKFLRDSGVRKFWLVRI